MDVTQSEKYLKASMYNAFCQNRRLTLEKVQGSINTSKQKALLILNELIKDGLVELFGSVYFITRKGLEIAGVSTYIGRGIYHDGRF